MSIVTIDDREPTIVVIDDDPLHLAYVTTLLRRAGVRVEGFDRAKPALHRLAQGDATHVVTDLLMPEADGIEVARVIRRDFPDVELVGISGCNPALRRSVSSLLNAMGIRDLLPKPIEPEALFAALSIHRKYQ